MLRRIPTTELRLGMFITELCGSWIDHPFWKKRFLLQDERDLRRLLDSGVAEVVIDTARGLDTAVANAEATGPAPAAPTAEPAMAVPLRVALDEEVSRAYRICARSRDAVVSMFNDVRMGQAIDAEKVVELVEEITESVLRNPDALISLARLKRADEYTYMHSVAVCALMIGLARQLGLSEQDVQEAGIAGLLHDVGKMAIPDAVLNKPGKLTDGEFAVVRNHPEAGVRLLRDSPRVSEIALDVCLHHHEKVDGTGYPHRLRGDQISLFARMGAVCDVYDAVTSNRPYKAGWDPAEAVRRMAEWSGSHFDEAVFQAFVKTVGIYPTGSLVRLESGRIGVVVEQHPHSLLKPRVKVFFSSKSREPIPQRVLDLAAPGVTERIVARESAQAWGFRHVDELWSGLPSAYA
ncbi:HD-GYP domain-containing protein [Stutzerimonas urumqiensis]|uniref:HD-GYP domain-containing protein n=1 Tax=Stutzerimonas urumqiensis TaxID=638269 RepID=UPI003DA3C045